MPPSQRLHVSYPVSDSLSCIRRVNEHRVLTFRRLRDPSGIADQSCTTLSLLRSLYVVGRTRAASRPGPSSPVPPSRRDAAVIAALRSVVARYPRWGFWKCYDRLRLEGAGWNCWHRRPIVRRPRQPHDVTGAANGQLGRFDQRLNRLSFRGRRYHFRAKTSLMAAFSSASSAYIRFSLACSPSSSRSRFTSDTDAPAYVLRHLKNVGLANPMAAQQIGEGDGSRKSLTALDQKF